MSHVVSFHFWRINIISKNFRTFHIVLEENYIAIIIVIELSPSPSVKTDGFFLRDSNRATHFSIIFIFPHIFCFAFLYPSTSIMCFQTIPFVSQPKSHWSVFQGGLGRGGIQSTSIGHRGSPRLGSWTPPLLHIHYITGSHHTGTWFLLPFLRWWHTALSLISTRWSNGSCTDLRLPGRHLGMDERTPSTAQPGKDRASCLPCHSNSTAWLHNSVRFINNYLLTSVRNLGVIFDDQLTFKEHISKTAGSCRFTLHNIRKIRPFLQSMLHNFLSRPLSFLD